MKRQPLKVNEWMRQLAGVVETRWERDSAATFRGAASSNFVQGAGKRIPTEGYIAWGLHYTPIGKPVVDRTRVGFWFQNEMTHEIVEIGPAAGQTHIVLGKQLVDDEFTPLRTSGVGNVGFPAMPVIPPHAKDWAITAVRAFQDDVTLYVMWPHMHTRGKEMTYVLTYPDGREQVLLSVPKYDFNWQIFYELKEPLKIPAGSTIKTDRILRQLGGEQVESGAAEGGVLVRAELGRDVRRIPGHLR